MAGTYGPCDYAPQLSGAGGNCAPLWAPDFPLRLALIVAARGPVMAVIVPAELADLDPRRVGEAVPGAPARAPPTEPAEEGPPDLATPNALLWWERVPPYLTPPHSRQRYVTTHKKKRNVPTYQTHRVHWVGGGKMRPPAWAIGSPWPLPRAMCRNRASVSCGAASMPTELSACRSASRLRQSWSSRKGAHAATPSEGVVH